MAAEEEFKRVDERATDDYVTESSRSGRFRDEPGLFEVKPGRAAQPAHPGQAGALNDPSLTGVRDPLPRSQGTPLPMGSPGRPLSSGQANRVNLPPPGRALSVQTQSEPEGSAMQWLSGVIKQAVPFVQKLLPLLDGQIASAAANLMTPRPHAPPAPHIDVQPIENGLADLQIQHANLKDQIADQNVSLKRMEDHLDMVREATDRNTLEQQELIEDLKVISSRMNRLAFLCLALLVISVLVNIALFLHIQRVLP
jgi:hypothetical protein